MKSSRLQLSESLNTAHKVLKELMRRNLPDGVHQDDVSVRVFDNCREIGYQIAYNGFRMYSATDGLLFEGKIYWAQSRSSDDIVVYSDTCDDRDFMMGNRMPCQDGWDRRKSFAWRNKNDAVKYILGRLEYFNSRLQEKLEKAKHESAN